MKSLSVAFSRAVLLKSASFMLFLLASGLPGSGQDDSSGRSIMVGSGLGYNFSSAGGNLGVNQTNAGSERIYGSWARGMTAGIDIGMEICNPVYATLSVNYLNGREVESSNLYESQNSSFYQTNLSHLRIPLVLLAGTRYYPDISCCLLNRLGISGGDRFQPYIGIGAGLALGARMKTTLTTGSSQEYYQNILQKKSTTTFKPALVTAGELGLTYRLSEAIKVYAGLECSSMSLMNSREKVHSYTEDGQDLMPELPVEEVETIFVKELEYEEIQDPSEPSRQLAEKYPASGVSFNVGILCNIGQAGNVPPPNPRPGKGLVPPGGRGIGRAADRVRSPVNEKVKAGAVNAICLNCPPVNLQIRSNNKEELFPEEDIEITESGAWGGAELKSLTTEESVILCTTCPGSGDACCCQLASLSVKLNFKMTLNLKKIEKGVWMNTNAEDKKDFGKTIVAKELPKSTRNPQDWRKVDRHSVEVHERQHFADLQEAIREALVDELKRFVVVQYPCGPASEEHCKKQIENDMRAISSRLQLLARSKAKEIATAENREYMSGDLEIKARTAQAAELNSRR